MFERIKIREKTLKDTDIILWKNLNKNPDNLTYNITISKKGMMFLSVSCMNKRDLSAMSSKYDAIIEWIEYLIKNDMMGEEL